MANYRPLIVNSSAQQIQEITDSDSLIGNGTIPIGGIIMWSGSVASIPTGWALCDGQNSTPDLRNKFIVGASSGTSVNYPGVGVGTTGGSANAVLLSHRHETDLDGENVQVETTSGGFSMGPGSQLATRINVGSHLMKQIGIDENGTSTTTADQITGTNKNLPPYYALAFIIRTV